MIDPTITHLRQLMEQQDYPALAAACAEAWAAQSDPATLPLLALAEAQQGDFHCAREHLQQAEALFDQLDVDARTDLAGACLVLLQFDRAIALLDDILAAAPEQDLALARRGFACMARGEPAEAAAWFERSLQHNPGRITVLLNRIHLHLQQQELSEAEARLAQAEQQLATRQGLPEAIRNQHRDALDNLRLSLWVKQGETAEAEAWVAEQGDVAGAQAHFARVLAENDRHAQAEAVLKEGLRRDPDNETLVRQFIELAQLLGRSHQAVHLIERRIARDRDNPEWWIALVNACLPQFEARAAQAADKALELCEALTVSDDNPEARICALRRQARLALAQVKANQQQYDEAEPMLLALLEEQPHLAPALRELGSLCLQRGRIDEAVAHFERLKQIDPVMGHGALINARRFPEDETTLEKIEQVARRPSLEGSLRSGLLFQLAAAWEKRKDYDKAFSLADEANRASKRFLHYDPKAHRNSCARIRALYSRDYFARRKDYGNPSTLPVFVLGMPRSGTTLVEQIIAGHSLIQGAGELGVIPARIQGLNRWERHIGSGREYPVCMDDVTAYVSQGIAQQVLDELQGYADEAKPGAKHVVDKLPHNFENIGFIKLLFPNARIISVRRDPRDIAMSNYFTDYQAKHGGMGFAYDLEWIGQQLADHNLLMHHWQQLFPNEILEINYEDVVEDTEGMARRMLDYIGVDWEPQVLAFNELDRPVKTASVWQVRQPIYKTSKAKWMNYKPHILPLVEAANAPIRPDPETIKLLPEPGMYTTAGSYYKADKLDEAEYEYKKLLHHIPDHGAANYQVGVIYWRKGHLKEAIPFLEKAHNKCPWQTVWRQGLIQAYEATGETDKAEALKQKYPARGPTADADSQGLETYQGELIMPTSENPREAYLDEVLGNYFRQG